MIIRACTITIIKKWKLNALGQLIRNQPISFQSFKLWQFGWSSRGKVWSIFKERPNTSISGHLVTGHCGRGVASNVSSGNSGSHYNRPPATEVRTPPKIFRYKPNITNIAQQSYWPHISSYLWFCWCADAADAAYFLTFWLCRNTTFQYHIWYPQGACYSKI